MSGGCTDVAVHTDGVLSLAYRTTRTVAGAAYPAVTLQAFTFDLASGQEVTLDDLLGPAGRDAFVVACGRAAVQRVPHAAQALAEHGVLVGWATLDDGLLPGTVVAPLAGR